MIGDRDPATIEGAFEIAAEIFDPAHLRPDPDGNTVIVSTECPCVSKLLGWRDRAGWEIVDPGTGETTVLQGRPFDPYVARKILAHARGYGLSMRPGETKAEALAAIRGYLEHAEESRP